MFKKYCKKKSVLLIIISSAFLFTGWICQTAADTPAVSKRAITPSPRTFNPIHIVVIFSKFKGESPGDSLAPVWANKMFENRLSSVPDYCKQVSFGQIKVTGEYLPPKYELPWESSYYVNNLEKYVKDLIELVDKDPTVDFSQFDNDGPDGKPSSGDDDGYVDYIVLMPMSHEYNFISKRADGKARLEINNYIQVDVGMKGDFIKIDQFSGSIATGINLNQAVGLTAHEYLEGFGTPDLNDTNYSDGRSDSAGIGYWGLTGWGSIGWYGNGRPIGLCAHTRMLLGCIGINNVNLIDLYGVHRDIRINDAAMVDGRIYRIWVTETEYFLIEHRRNDGMYYDRDLPRSGILIWHVNDKSYNDDEENKRVDLECADGRYLDAGYPWGQQPHPDKGGDNLDFWAHDIQYAENHEGNLGDATDVFDGIQFTRFGPDTNPNSGMNNTYKYTGIDIYNIRPDGKDMLFDVIAPPLTDWGRDRLPLIGTALHRTTFNENNGTGTSKGSAAYLVNYGQSLHAEELVTVYGDSITVDNLVHLNIPETQRVIESRIAGSYAQKTNYSLERKNIAVEEFENDIKNSGATPRELYKGKHIMWVQKLNINQDNHSLLAPIDLQQNFPNPFNATTSVSYILPEIDHVTLEVFNILGQKVLSIDRGFQKSGYYTVPLDFGNLSSGVYFYRIHGKTITPAKKCMLVR